MQICYILVVQGIDTIFRLVSFSGLNKQIPSNFWNDWNVHILPLEHFEDCSWYFVQYTIFCVVCRCCRFTSSWNRHSKRKVNYVFWEKMLPTGLLLPLLLVERSKLNMMTSSWLVLSGLLKIGKIFPRFWEVLLLWSLPLARSPLTVFRKQIRHTSFILKRRNKF